MNQWDRSERLVGKKGMERLRQASVLVVGLGGVGSYCVEALARSGIGHLRIVDHDTIALSNCNRQLHALHSTLGRSKVEVMMERIRDIDRTIEVEGIHEYFSESTAERAMAGGFSFLVDAIDSLGPKLALLDRGKALEIRVVTVLGAARRLDPTRVRVAPLEKTLGDPLAARVRKSMRRRSGLDHITAVYSIEPPCPCDELEEGRKVLPSMTFVPAAMGLAAASVVVQHLVGESI